MKIKQKTTAATYQQNCGKTINNNNSDVKKKTNTSKQTNTNNQNKTKQQVIN